ncbi:MAG: TetR/AcrR family transcriptional regulator [bacterium]|nr:TetR/AcrR family transcriptional regulator [bacterium]
MPRAKTPDAKTRARQAREAVYRDAICEAAEDCFAARGIDETKVEEIAAEAGLSLATLYSVFKGGKSEIARTVHDVRMSELARFGPDAESSGHAPEAALREAFHGAIDFLMAHPSYLRIHLAEGHAWGLPDAVGARSQADARSFREGVGALERLVERGIEDGTFRETSARRAARTLVMMQQVHLADWIEDGERADPDAVFVGYWRDAAVYLGLENGEEA